MDSLALNSSISGAFGQGFLYNGGFIFQMVLV